MYVRRVDLSVVTVILSLNRHPHIYIPFIALALSVVHNRNKVVEIIQPVNLRVLIYNCKHTTQPRMSRNVHRKDTSESGA